MLHIGVQIIEVRADADAGSSNRSLGEDFLARSGQALVAGGYDKARPYSVESLLLYTLCKHFRKDDQETNTWLMMSVCARMAVRYFIIPFICYVGLFWKLLEITSG